MIRLVSKTLNKYLFSNSNNSCLSSPLGCSNIQQFRTIMFQTFKKNKQNIQRIVQNQGLNANLYFLSTLDDHQIPQSIYKRIISSLTKSDQKITSQNYKYILQRLPNQKQLHQIYSKPQRQFTTQTTFNINNTIIDTHLVQNSLSLNYQKYNKLILQKSSHVFEDKVNQQTQRAELITKFKGEELNKYVRGIISEDQLFYDETIDEFLFKYNDKLLKQYPSNILFRYAMRSIKYPLEVNLIDLPHIFIMEQLCQRKSLKQLENTLEVANLLNLLCKLKQTKNPQLKCPKVLAKVGVPHLSMPDGYYPYLARDEDLFSKAKVQYMMTNIDEIVKQSSKKKHQILLLLSNQYAPFVRDYLKKYEQSQGQLNHDKVTLDTLQNHIMSRSAKLQKEQGLNIPMKKSVIAQLLFEVNTVQTLEYYRSLGDEIARQYFSALQQYSDKMTLQALDVSAGAKLQSLFQKQPPCQLLELIFGNEAEFAQTAYTQQTIKKIFSKLDTQTGQKGESGKIKLNKDI